MIINRYISTDKRVKKKLWSWKEMIVAYFVLLLMVGLQMGIIAIPVFDQLESVMQVTIIMVYWVCVAAAIIGITNHQIKRTYEIPLQELSAAAKQVADGDFSVYIKPVHTEEHADYIDVMYSDFNKMVAELGSIETLKNDFVSNVSHEIKTPMAIICNYMTTLQNTDLTEKERNECIEELFAATNRLNSLVTNILKLNRLDSQAIQMNCSEYDLCGQLSECALSFEPLWEKKEIEIDVKMEDHAMIYADEETMKLVWNNLISNAIKFTPKGGKISLNQETNHNYIVVEISDTGCGMSEDTMIHIFEKFYQGDTSHSTEGNGLGLALASKIVDYSGGTLTVQSSLGEGSIFKVTLPIHREISDD